MKTHVKISITVSNPEGTKAGPKVQEFDLAKSLPDDKLSPAADKAVRAAARALGVKVPKARDVYP